MNRPLMFNDEQWGAVRGALLAPQAPELLRCLVNARHLDERRGLMRAALHTSGFDWLAYGRMWLSPPTTRTTSFLRSYANQPWTQRYFDEGWQDIDFRHQLVQPCGMPLLWDADDVSARMMKPDATQRHLAFGRHLADCGIRSGALFHFPSAFRDDECTVLSLSSRLEKSRFAQGSALGHTLLLAWCIHEFLSTHLRVHPSMPGADWGMRAQVMRALAQGLSNKEISARLQVSIHTVEHQLRQLRRQFGANNRVALVQAAASQCDTLG